jgi:hypothetical protein
MTNAYRSMQPMPPCWCKSYPPGFLFFGWVQEDRSLPLQEVDCGKTNYMHLSVEHWSHTSECLRERQDRSLTDIVSYQTVNHYDPPGAEPVGTWRWKARPLFGCYFLRHSYQIIKERRSAYGNYDIEVCRCRALRVITYDCLPVEGSWQVKDRVVYHKWAAWGKTSGTHSGGPR